MFPSKLLNRRKLQRKSQKMIRKIGIETTYTFQVQKHHILDSFGWEKGLHDNYLERKRKKKIKNTTLLLNILVL